VGIVQESHELIVTGANGQRQSMNWKEASIWAIPSRIAGRDGEKDLLFSIKLRYLC